MITRPNQQQRNHLGVNRCIINSKTSTCDTRREKVTCGSTVNNIYLVIMIKPLILILPKLVGKVNRFLFRILLYDLTIKTMFRQVTGSPSQCERRVGRKGRD